MELKIINRDLFQLSYPYYLVHCISSDFKLGAGIAKQFRDRGVVNELESRYTRYWSGKGYCLYTSLEGYQGVFNLVTKENYYDKPTYATLIQALEGMRLQLINNHTQLIAYNTVNTKYLAMPKIGCGLDQLEWSRVESIIRRTFCDMNDINITICYL